MKKYDLIIEPKLLRHNICSQNIDCFKKHLTAKNTVISPNFLVWKFCGKVQFLQSFVLCGNCLFTKFPQQETRWNYCIFRSVCWIRITLKYGDSSPNINLRIWLCNFAFSVLILVLSNLRKMNGINKNTYCAVLNSCLIAWIKTFSSCQDFL